MENWGHWLGSIAGARPRYWLAALAGGMFLSLASAAEPPVATVHRLNGKIQLDGLLNEPVWQSNPYLDGFRQVEPRTGAPPTHPTRVWLAYNEHALYIAVRCYDSEPSKIVATEMSRDARLFSNDNIEIVLDTHHDRRNAYYFATNPAGVLVDGRITENRFPNTEWDGIWNVRARIDDEGWTAEFEIPFKTLSFKPGLSTWGFNIARLVARTREMSRWASPSRDTRLFQVARAGVIEGLEGLSQGIGLDIRPYGLTGFSRHVDRPDAAWLASDAGLDIFYRITANLLSTTTFNTDFAETEADVRQVNLTRFPLFFPERRSFFLEDAGMFEFGLAGSYMGPGAGGLMGGGGGGRGGRMIDVLPFFSRRIGLVKGEEVPIRFGQKLTGKVGRFDVGLMAIRTGRYESTVSDLNLEPQTLSVGRVKANFWRQSYVGAIFTDGDPTGQTTSRLGGADFKLATANFLNSGKNFSLTLFGSKVYTQGVSGGDTAYGGEIAYPNDFFMADARWLTIGHNYKPALGFVPRTGVRITSSTVALGPRPDFWNIRQMTFGVRYTDYHNLTHKAPETRRIQVTPIQWRFHSGELLNYSWTPTFEQLFEPFQIRPDIAIPVGKYWLNTHRLMFFSSQARPWGVRLEAESGSFYTGTRRMVSVDLTWRKSRHLRTELELEQNWVQLNSAGRFSARVISYGLNYSFTPLITLANLVQYDTDSSNLGWQSRLRWILKPGNELYIVLNQGWQRNEFRRLASEQTHLRLKLNYVFRF